MHEVREEYSVLRTIRFSAVLLANLPFFAVLLWHYDVRYIYVLCMHGPQCVALARSGEVEPKIHSNYLGTMLSFNNTLHIQDLPLALHIVLVIIYFELLGLSQLNCLYSVPRAQFKHSSIWMYKNE